MIDLVKVGLLALAAVPATAQAQNATPCLDGRRTSVEVTAVVDGRGFVLADSREARLVSLEMPPAGAETVARDALARLIAGQRIAVIAADQPDRYGRLVVRGAILDGAARSVEETLLAQGGGRVAAIVPDRNCRAALLAAERSGRGSGLGIWENNEILQAVNVERLVAERGHFAIVEGRVVSARESGSTIYINFGRRWSRDFSVTISKRNERIFTAAGLEPKKLEGRRLRVRGYIEMRLGPWIEAIHPAQIEVAEDR